jgi:trimeric autotransporter adhesin
MKNTYILLILLFSPFLVYAQIFVEESTDGSITLTPKGLSSANSNVTALGQSALKNVSPTATNNVAIGSFSLFSNTTGISNVAFGSEALYSNVANIGSTALGYRAMYNADNRATGVNTYNTAIGSYALQGGGTPSANTGIKNTAIGFEVLMQNSSGSENTASGYTALKANTTGSFNTASGAYSMYKNTTANAGTAAGVFSLSENLSGEQNLAIGYAALKSNKYGVSNTVVGSKAMQNIDSVSLASNNVAIGFSALKGEGFNFRGTFGGINNVAVGANAAERDTSGNDNVVLGAGALKIKYAGDGNTVIGQNADVGGFFGYHNVFQSTTIGINKGASVRTTAVGTYAVDLQSPENTPTYNTGIGYNAMSASSSSTGTHNTALGSNSLSYLTTGSRNTVIGADDEALPGPVSSGNNNILIGFGSNLPSATANNQVRVGASNITYAGIQVPWNCSSDRRWKENIEPLSLGMNFVKALRPVTYHRKNNPNADLEMGLIAQEVEETLNKMGIKDVGLLHKDDNGYLSIRYNDLIAVLVKAIQEQQAEIEVLEKESTAIGQNRQEIVEEYRALSAKIKALSVRFSNTSSNVSTAKIITK